MDDNFAIKEEMFNKGKTPIGFVFLYTAKIDANRFPLFLFETGPCETPRNSPSILAMLETLQNAPHLEVHKDMIRWILKVNCTIPYYKLFL